MVVSQGERQGRGAPDPRQHTSTNFTFRGGAVTRHAVGEMRDAIGFIGIRDPAGHGVQRRLRPLL